jgi:hypothetical protein
MISLASNASYRSTILKVVVFVQNFLLTFILLNKKNSQLLTLKSQRHLKLLMFKTNLEDLLHLTLYKTTAVKSVER